MSAKLHSAAIICGMEDADQVDRISCALGYAPYDFEAGEPASKTAVVALSSNGETPVERWGTHTHASDQFIELFTAAQEGSVPQRTPEGAAWKDYGTSAEKVAGVVSRSVFRYVRDTFQPKSWRIALDEAGMQPIRDDESQEVQR